MAHDKQLWGSVSRSKVLRLSNSHSRGSGNLLIYDSMQGILKKDSKVAQPDPLEPWERFERQQWGPSLFRTVFSVSWAHHCFTGAKKYLEATWFLKVLFQNKPEEIPRVFQETVELSNNNTGATHVCLCVWVWTELWAAMCSDKSNKPPGATEQL